jgi:hypothetical protein
MTQINFSIRAHVGYEEFIPCPDWHVQSQPIKTQSSLEEREQYLDPLLFPSRQSTTYRKRDVTRLARLPHWRAH